MYVTYFTALVDYKKRPVDSLISLRFILPLTSSFVAVIMATATRGHSLVTNVNMGRVKPLGFST